jgi:lipopolysaccharide export system permease protein
LLSVLTGTFRRHGSFIRPLVAVGTMVVLLALGFAVQNLAAGNTVWLPLMWLQAIGPGVVCAWLLLGPQLLDRFRFRYRPAPA